MATFNTISHAFAREALSVTSGAAVALTATLYNNAAATALGNQMPTGKRKANSAKITVRTADINVTEDGTTPTTGAAGVGTTMGDRDIILLASYDAIVKFRAIAASATATIEAVYYY